MLKRITKRRVLPLTGLRSSELETHVVGHDLSPLHVVDGELGILLLAISKGVQRDQTGVGQFVASHGPGRHRNTIGVLGGQQT